MSGVAGRSGRRKNFKHQIYDAINNVDANIGEIFQTLIDKAKGGDKECAMYLVDRVMGRPRQEIDQRVKAMVIVSPDDYEMAVRVAIADEKKLLELPVGTE